MAGCEQEKSMTQKNANRIRTEEGYKVGGMNSAKARAEQCHL